MGQGLSAYLEGFDIEDDEKTALNEFEEFENENITKSWGEKKSLAEMNERGPGDFSMHEFNLMQDSEKFADLLKINEILDKKRPTFDNGDHMTEEQIQEEANEYLECKKQKDWKNYSPAEINLMKKCATWNYYYNKITKMEKHPAGDDGKKLTQSEMEEFAKEYKELKTKNPKIFEKYKIENKEWIKDKFNWKEKDYNGKKQYQCYKKTIDPNTKKVVTIKYILKDINSSSENMTFVIKKEIPVKEDFIIKILGTTK